MPFFQEKRGCFCENLIKFFRLKLTNGVKFEGKIQQSPCLGVDFCIMTKMCLGVYIKTVVHTCVHLHI